MATHSELASVAKMLQEAAQTLLHLSESPPSGEFPQSAVEGLARQDDYRFYRVPSHILDDERELLAEYETDRMAHVLREIYTEFFLMLELMKGYAERNDDEDFTYFLLAQQLFKPLESLSRACSVLVDFELQAKEPIKQV